MCSFSLEAIGSPKLESTPPASSAVVQPQQQEMHNTSSSHSEEGLESGVGTIATHTLGTESIHELDRPTNKEVHDHGALLPVPLPARPPSLPVPTTQFAANVSSHRAMPDNPRHRTLSAKPRSLRFHLKRQSPVVTPPLQAAAKSSGQDDVNHEYDQIPEQLQRRWRSLSLAASRKESVQNYDEPRRQRVHTTSQPHSPSRRHQEACMAKMREGTRWPQGHHHPSFTKPDKLHNIYHTLTEPIAGDSHDNERNRSHSRPLPTNREPIPMAIQADGQMLAGRQEALTDQLFDDPQYDVTSQALSGLPETYASSEQPNVYHVLEGPVPEEHIYDRCIPSGCSLTSPSAPEFHGPHELNPMLGGASNEPLYDSLDQSLQVSVIDGNVCIAALPE